MLFGLGINESLEKVNDIALFDMTISNGRV
jgi:hypothetical protein